MEPIQGKNAIIYFNNGTDYVPWVCCEEFSIETTTETVNTQTVGDGAWRRPRGRKLGYTLELSGVNAIAADGEDVITGFDLLEHQIEFVEIQYRLVWEVPELSKVKVIEGSCLPVRSSFTGPTSDFSSSSLTCDGVGPFEVRNSIDTCLTAIDITNPFAVVLGMSTTVVVNDVIGSWMAFEWYIDGAEDETEMSYTNEWSVPEGEHTITITPICPNGLPGVPYDFEYTL